MQRRLDTPMHAGFSDHGLAHAASLERHACRTRSHLVDVVLQHRAHGQLRRGIGVHVARAGRAASRRRRRPALRPSQPRRASECGTPHRETHRVRPSVGHSRRTAGTHSGSATAAGSAAAAGAAGAAGAACAQAVPISAQGELPCECGCQDSEQLSSHVNRPGVAASEGRAANIWKHHTCCVIASACEKVLVSGLPRRGTLHPRVLEQRSLLRGYAHTSGAAGAAAAGAGAGAAGSAAGSAARGAGGGGGAAGCAAASGFFACAGARVTLDALAKMRRCLAARPRRRAAGARLGHHHHHKAGLRDVVVRERAFILEHLATPATPGPETRGHGSKPRSGRLPGHGLPTLPWWMTTRDPAGKAVPCFSSIVCFTAAIWPHQAVSVSPRTAILLQTYVCRPAYLFSPLQLQGEVGPSHRLEGDLHGAALAFHRA